MHIAFEVTICLGVIFLVPAISASSNKIEERQSPNFRTQLGRWHEQNRLERTGNEISAKDAVSSRPESAWVTSAVKLGAEIQTLTAEHDQQAKIKNQPLLVRIGSQTKEKKIIKTIYTPWLMYMLKNFTLNGHIVDDYQTPIGGNEVDSARNKVGMNLMISTKGFIWRPWLSTLSGGLGISAEKVNSSKYPSASQNLIGDLKFDLFPRSRFPFLASYERKRDQLDDNRFGITTATEIISMDQKYLTLSETAYSVSYERRKVDATASGYGERDGRYNPKDVSDKLNFNISKAYGNHDIKFANELYQVEHLATTDNRKTANILLKDRYAPKPGLTVDTTANFSETKERLSFGTELIPSYNNTTQHIQQLTSYTFWAPPDKSFTSNAGIRYFSLENSQNIVKSEGPLLSSGSNRIANVDIFGGTIHNITENLSLSENGAINQNLTGAKELRTNLNGLLSYSSDETTISKLSWNWFTNLSLTHNTTDKQKSLYIRPKLGHNLSRSISTGDGSRLKVLFSQSYSLQQYLSSGGYANPESVSDSKQELIHKGALGWSIKGSRGFARVRLSISDIRSMEETESFDEDVFQRSSFQTAANWRLSRFSHIVGDFMFQISKRKNKIFNLDEDDTYSNGSITYQNMKLFGVRRLAFSSMFRVRDDSIFYNEDEENEKERLSFENKLFYSIGRIQATMNLTLSQVAGENRSLFMIRIARAFNNK